MRKYTHHQLHPCIVYINSPLHWYSGIHAGRHISFLWTSSRTLLSWHFKQSQELATLICHQEAESDCIQRTRMLLTYRPSFRCSLSVVEEFGVTYIFHRVTFLICKACSLSPNTLFEVSARGPLYIVS